jgi:hypothetical protein
MTWPFKTIKQQSEWPFHHILVGLAGSCLAVPNKERGMMVGKTVERCLRLGAKLAVEFGMPPCLFIQMAERQMIREGGPEVAAHLAEHKATAHLQDDETASAAADVMSKILSGKVTLN